MTRLVVSFLCSVIGISVSVLPLIQMKVAGVALALLGLALALWRAA